MDITFIIKQLYDTAPEPFMYCTGVINRRYFDLDGNITRDDSICNLVIIEFLKSFKDKYKPIIQLSNDKRVTVNINVVNYGYFCFPITGYDEHHRESLAICPWFGKFVEDGNNVEEVLMICDWIEKVCLPTISVACHN